MTTVTDSETSRDVTGTPRLLIASSDSHVSPRLEQYREYCPQRYLEDFDDYVVAAAAQSEHDAMDKLFETAIDEGYIKASEEINTDPRINYDPHVAVQHMDQDGVAVDTFFHGSDYQPIPFLGLVGFFAHRPYYEGARGFELAQVGMRMYNRLMADYCSVAPERLIGLAYLPMWDVDSAVAELKFAREAGLRGINFPAPRPTIPDYNEMLWEPLWSAAESLGMPLNTHGGNAPTIMDVASYTGPGGFQCMLVDVLAFGRRALPFMIFGGVFERHPGLKLIFAEQSSEWIESTLFGLDGYSASAGFPLALPRKPSEYFWSNCYIGASFMSNREARDAVARGMSSKVLWGRDFPHIEGAWPYTRLSLRKAAEGVPADALREMLGVNLVDLYQLDRAKLDVIADRIGPTMDEITTPLPRSEIPAHAKWTSAFHDSESFFS